MTNAAIPAVPVVSANCSDNCRFESRENGAVSRRARRSRIAVESIVTNEQLIPELPQTSSRLPFSLTLAPYLKSSCSMPVLRNRRACPGEAYEPTKIEQYMNILTHAVFIYPAAQQMLKMIELSSHQQHHHHSRSILWWTAISYGTASIMLFLISTIFHLLCLFRVENAARFLFHMFDRASIFLFISSSYLPWLNVKRLHGWAWPLRWFVWMSACGGITYQYCFHERYKTLEVIIYTIHGTLPGFVMLLALETSAEWTGLPQMLLGCAVYGVGIIFFKLDGILPFAHAVWHLFVAGGAFIHLDAVQKYIYLSEEVK